MKARNPYLEATVEETVRCAKVLSITMRDALVDTEVMGYPIPKGTMVGLSSEGPGLTLPSNLVDCPKTPKGGKDAKYGGFDDATITQFLPERWLRRVDSCNATTGEEVVFDANAGPSFALGQGPRACFGKKLAYIQMRIFFTIMFWIYNFLPLPEELAGFEDHIVTTRVPKQAYARMEKILY